MCLDSCGDTHCARDREQDTPQEVSGMLSGMMSVGVLVKILEVSFAELKASAECSIIPRSSPAPQAGVGGMEHGCIWETPSKPFAELLQLKLTSEGHPNEIL